MPKNIKRIYGLTWLLTVVLILVDIVWANLIDFRVEHDSAIESIQVISSIAAFSAIFLLISRREHRLHSRKLFYGNVAQLFMWITVLVVFTHACALFQYLCITTNLPLMSGTFVSADAALGFHWLDHYRWINAHDSLHSLLAFAYASGSIQLFAIPVILAITSHAQDYAELVVQYAVAIILVILIGALIPAESAYVHFALHDPNAVSTVSDFALLRSGIKRELAFSSVQGLVSFPSFHCILALCYAYALRHVRFVFPIGVALNLLMIVSTPTQGGHYLFDVLSGVMVGVLVIYLVRRFFQRPAYSAHRAPTPSTSPGINGTAATPHP
jgi:membrane-associated phospholipid phosphatase